MRIPKNLPYQTSANVLAVVHWRSHDSSIRMPEPHMASTLADYLEA